MLHAAHDQQRAERRGRSRSPCRGRARRTIRPAIAAADQQQRPHPSSERVRSGLRGDQRAAYSTSASFASSDGWIWSGPAPSQRRAPFASMPKPGTSTSSRPRERDRQEHRREPLRRSSSPWRAKKRQRDEAERRGDEVALQVLGAVAAVRQQRRAGARAVDHHRAERDQAERRRAQHRVLERHLARSAAVQRQPRPRGSLTRSSQRLRTSARKCSPRSSKSRYWSKLAQAGASSTTSPGCARRRRLGDGALEVAAVGPARRRVPASVLGEPVAPPRRSGSRRGSARATGAAQLRSRRP